MAGERKLRRQEATKPRSRRVFCTIVTGLLQLRMQEATKPRLRLVFCTIVTGVLLALLGYHLPDLSLRGAGLPEVLPADASARMPATAAGVCVYQLPAKFNTELTDSAGRIELDPEPLYVNGSDLHGAGLYNTDTFCLERVLFTRMTQQAVDWRNPSECVAFYIPYFTAFEQAGHGKWRERDTPQLDDELLKHLVHLRRGDAPAGQDHFIAAGRVVDDVSFYLDPRLQNVMKLTIESSSRKRTPNKTIAVPYPSTFRYNLLLEQSGSKLGPCWLRGRCQKPLGEHRRGPLASIVAGYGQGPYSQAKRRQVVTWCEERSSLCSVLPTGLREAAADDGPRINFVSFQLYAASVFCLQPPGDTPTRKAIFDSLLAGCIPVIVDNRSMSQYVWHMPDWRELSVLYELRNVTPDHAHLIDDELCSPARRKCVNVEGFFPDPGQQNVIDYLRDLETRSPEIIREKQARIARRAYGLQYAVEPASARRRLGGQLGPDALDVILEQVLQVAR